MVESRTAVRGQVDEARPGGGLARERPAAHRHRQLSEMVASHVREAIMVGDFRAQEFIRTERLAEELGVSPTPVREALMVLHSEGSVRWEPRRGYRVVPLTAQDVEDVFAVQAHLAGELAARAASVLDHADVELLRARQANLEEALRRGDTTAVESLNHQIHRAINRSSGSWRLAMLLRSSVKYVPVNFFGTVPGWAEASAHDHAAILEALDQRDGAAARRAMEYHIIHCGGLLARHLTARGVLDGGNRQATQPAPVHPRL